VTAISIKGVSKKFGKNQVLKDINLDIEQGELLVILGPSGSGKSTLLRVISGLENPDSGKIYFDGEDVTSFPPSKRGIGMVFQDYAIWPHLSVEENLMIVMEDKKFGKDSRDEIEKEIAELTYSVGLGDKLKRMPHELSGGELQRVGIARALASKPKLLLLDEPLSNLDERIRKELLIKILEIVKDRKLTAIMVTHSQDEAFEIADRIAIINSGRIEQVGKPEEIFFRPSSKFVAQFIGENLQLEGTIQEILPESIKINLGPLGNIKYKKLQGFKNGEKVSIIVRTSDLKLSSGVGDNGIEGRVVDMKRFKNNYRIFVELNDKRIIKFTASEIPEDTNISRCFINFDTEKSFIFKEN